MRYPYVLYIATLTLLAAHTVGITRADDEQHTIEQVQDLRLAAADARDGTASPEAHRAASGREIKSAVVHPFRSSNVPSEVSGVVTDFRYRVGDRVKRGDVVAVVSPKRYALAVTGCEQRLKADELSLKYADERVKATEALLSLDWTTTQKLIEAKEQAAICRARVEASRRHLEAAQLDLEACNVKAPFDGYLAVLYKEPFEATERLEKLFLLIDTGKVYAVANVPEGLVKSTGKKARAVFTRSTGARFTGTVDRVGKLFNPESRTGRVWVLLDNPQGELEVGMTGTLGFD